MKETNVVNIEDFLNKDALEFIKKREFENECQKTFDELDTLLEYNDRMCKQFPEEAKDIGFSSLGFLSSADSVSLLSRSLLLLSKIFAFLSTNPKVYSEIPDSILKDYNLIADKLEEGLKGKLESISE